MEFLVYILFLLFVLLICYCYIESGYTSETTRNILGWIVSFVDVDNLTFDEVSDEIVETKGKALDKERCRLNSYDGTVD